MKKAIVIGASSGIGREVAIQLIDDDYTVGITARRVPLLEELKDKYENKVHVKKMDISKTEEAMKELEELIKELGGLDLIVINSGYGHVNLELDWGIEKQTIEVNALGFTSIANVAYRYFSKQKSGCIVGISSIAGIRGSSYSPAYGATKSYLSNYLEGLRCKAKKEKMDIKVIDIKPGFVDTAMGQGDKAFWVAPVEVAAKQILEVIKKGKEKAVVTKRWRLIAWLMRIIPEWLYYKI
ncbi:SDR family NAD(P)-dependent oxidoreductase [Vallitalea okinawensis]|uniref:SDR family NAD(P)-dependent oxidoreductase n=1 Tax=Vallitalea okinawensis TaxID=2078660 RepID=UPI000CFD4078|nr:SDR family NAD(P)-dependent oxidoreductase [Vallitalea okinawensis]